MIGAGMLAAFCALAALTLASALCVVLSRNIAHAGFWLLPCFLGVAGLFATLEAHFLFVIQLLIYAGAILVLILFVLMLTRDVMKPGVPQSNRSGPLAALLCAALAIGLTYGLTRQSWPDQIVVAGTRAMGQTRALGQALIGDYALPFEVSSLVLVAALIGAVVLARSVMEPEPPAPTLAEPVARIVDEAAAVVEDREPAGVVGR